MENTMTTSGDVDTTVAITRVWSQRPIVGDTPRRRPAAVQTPFQGTTLSVAGACYAGPEKKAPLAGVAGTAISTMDAPFRTGRPPV